MGHLAGNGGIQGHSAGHYYPFRVVGLGNYWVVCSPCGKWNCMKYEDGSRAERQAENDHKRWQEWAEYSWQEYLEAWYVETPQEVTISLF